MLPFYTMLVDVAAACRAFRHGKSGNVAVIFALALLPIVGIVGSAVDYARAANLHSRLQAAADAAAIGAVAMFSPGYDAAIAMANDGSVAPGVTQALNIFNANIAGRNSFTLTQLNATVARSAQQLNATVTFTASLQTDFMQLFGQSVMTITGSAAASKGLPTYIDFYLLLDNTPSMGIGATPADLQTMVSNTPDQCAFACHDTANSNNYYNLAKSLGVTMRVDVVRTATQQLMGSATTATLTPSQYRMAIYTFGATAASAGLTNISPLTANLTKSASDAAAIDLMTVTSGKNIHIDQFNDQNTDFDGVLTAMNKEIPPPGNGQSASTPQKVLFLVSDGVADEANSNCQQPTTHGDRCQEPINTALCTTIKNRGIMIAVLYTSYLPLPTNPWYNTYIAPFQDAIPTHMQACASPNLYFEVTPTDGLAAAMNALFQKAIAQTRLTQ